MFIKLCNRQKNYVKACFKNDTHPQYRLSVEIALRAMGVTEMKPKEKYAYFNVYLSPSGDLWVGSPNASREEADTNLAVKQRVVCKRIVVGEIDD